METEEMDNTPVSESVETPEVSPPVTPVVPEPVLTPPTPGRDIDAELSAKDLEIKRLSEAWLESKNSHHMTRDEINKARVALAEAVQERERLVADKDKQLQETQDQLEVVSQATQTLTKEKTELTSELEQQAAKATKLEILTEEFPELLRYAKLIPASRDPEMVRAACQALAEARKQDLEAQRIGAVTGNPLNALPSTPTRVEAQLNDPEQMRSYLAEAKNNPQEYERRRQLLLDQFQAVVARNQSS